MTRPREGKAKGARAGAQALSPDHTLLTPPLQSGFISKPDMQVGKEAVENILTEAIFIQKYGKNNHLIEYV